MQGEENKPSPAERGRVGWGADATTFPALTICLPFSSD
ncbi:protein of unknown function [Azospirillum baldaniorum]|uniref:Uncharacterized protein n=1 Tax=Azospirillum baldaniorum TaxID=1064539 RepID=A0A9P1JS03_9PROT|nr:protein of unknown function [Azospirillum baldaniorum]